MAKKQVKVSLENLSKFISTKAYLNFILSNKTVFLARPVSIQSDSVDIKNTKGHVLHLPLNQIVEIWAEEKVS